MLKVAGVTAADVVYTSAAATPPRHRRRARFRARGVGVEIDAPLVQESRDAAVRAGVSDRATFLWQDLFTTNITPPPSSRSTCGTTSTSACGRSCCASCPGTRVVSHDFGMGDGSRTARSARGPDREHTIYFWLVPADAEARGT